MSAEDAADNREQLVRVLRQWWSDYEEDPPADDTIENLLIWLRNAGYQIVPKVELERLNRTITAQASTLRMGRVKELETRVFGLEEVREAAERVVAEPKGGMREVEAINSLAAALQALDKENG